MKIREIKRATGKRLAVQRTGSCCTDTREPSEKSIGTCCGTVSQEQQQATRGSCCSHSPAPSPDKPPCCGPPATTRGGVIDERVPGFLGWQMTGAGRVPRVGSDLTRADRFGAWKARWGINRMGYIVPPGLYAIGTPTPEDPVVVTANYKMSYDLVRQALVGRSVWLLVLETFGINVWCAAGKGTFGTDELVARIDESGLLLAVSHHTLLLPILGAPGVAAHEVQRRTGFRVHYATMRAADLPAYLDGGNVSTAAMRELTFTMRERLVLVPVEIVHALPSTAVITVCLLVLGFLLGGPAAGIKTGTAYLGAMATGVVIGPLLLPWLPGRSFAIKGAGAGLLWSAAWYILAGGTGWNLPVTLAAFLALPAVSAFYTLNFTGCSTYTSRTGVKKEMRRAIPAMGCALAASALLLVAGLFV